MGTLTVGELVRDLKNHPLYHETPTSYLSQYKLWECHCDCGNVKLFSENVLSAGELRSCGCLRMKMRQEAWERKKALAQRKAHKREIQFKLSCAMDKLAVLKLAPPGHRNELLLEETGKEIRRLRSMKAFANRK